MAIKPAKMAVLGPNLKNDVPKYLEWARSLPDSLVYNVYKVVHTPHHAPPHGYDIKLYNAPSHHIKAVHSCTTHIKLYNADQASMCV